MILRENKKGGLRTAFCYRPAIINLEDFSFFHKGFVDSFHVTFMIAPGKQVPAGNEQCGNQGPITKPLMP